MPSLRVPIFPHRPFRKPGAHAEKRESRNILRPGGGRRHAQPGWFVIVARAPVGGSGGGGAPPLDPANESRNPGPLCEPHPMILCFVPPAVASPPLRGRALGVRGDVFFFNPPSLGIRPDRFFSLYDHVFNPGIRSGPINPFCSPAPNHRPAPPVLAACPDDCHGGVRKLCEMTHIGGTSAITNYRALPGPRHCPQKMPLYLDPRSKLAILGGPLSHAPPVFLFFPPPGPIRTNLRRNL